MSIFFYANTVSTLSNHWLSHLIQFPELKNISILSGPSLFASPLALNVRSGDILILFAGNVEGFEHLLSLKDDLIDFRIILILADSSSKTIQKAHLLQPSFIACYEDDILKIQAVINKMVHTETEVA